MCAVNYGILQLIVNLLRRDQANGQLVRGEIADELQQAIRIITPDVEEQRFNKNWPKEELELMAESLIDGYEKTVNVGEVTGIGHDVLLPTATAGASAFITEYLETFRRK